MSLKSDLTKYTPRKEQIDALEFIKKNKTDMSDKKFFLLDLPTGIGKSNLAMMIADWYTSQVDKSPKVDIIILVKILQVSI
jgi:superfamily II DNA or RNA helicase